MGVGWVGCSSYQAIDNSETMDIKYILTEATSVELAGKSLQVFHIEPFIAQSQGPTAEIANGTGLLEQIIDERLTAA